MGDQWDRMMDGEDISEAHADYEEVRARAVRRYGEDSPEVARLDAAVRPEREV